MNKAARILMTLACVLYVLCMFALLTGSWGYEKETPSYAGSVQRIDQVRALVGGTESDITLPYNFSPLTPRTPVTLSTEIRVEDGDCLYVKSVYAPLKVYADDTLIFTCGQEGSLPGFMSDPPTTVVVVPLDNFSGMVRIRLEYLSPQTRRTLSVQPPLLGKSADIFSSLERTLGIPFVISLVQITLGVLLFFIGLTVCLFERRGVVFLYLGLASLAVGVWCFGESNLTGLFIPNPTLLYLLAFMGLYTIPIPLLSFSTAMISFHDERVLHFLYLVDLSATAAAFLLQLLGIVGFSQSISFFRVLLVFSLLLLAWYILHEGLRYKNQSARRFFAPMAVLAASATLEAVNYSLRFTDVLSSIFQIGAMVFTIMTGVIGGLFVRDAWLLKQQKQQLTFEVSLMETQIKEQKKRLQVLLQNAKAVREQRHDLRHQLAVIRNYCEEGNHKKLTDYLDMLIANIPPEQKNVYCENPAVNAIVSHYAAIAEEKGIECSIRLTVPEHLEQSIEGSLCVIFGNLLENAIEACSRMTEGQKYIRLNSRLQYKTLTITMDNSFNGKFTEQGGRMISSKRGDFGIGTSSIATVAEQHGGGASFGADGLVFLSSVYIRL